MKTQLTPEQIASYREQGFVLVEGFLDADELAAWRTAVDEAVAGRGEVRIPGHDAPKADGEKKPADYYSQVFIQRVNLWQTHEGIKRLVLDERIGKMCCDLEGVDGVRVWHDQALIKAPWANATAFHLDNPYWSYDSRHAISIWIALDDVTMQNGALYFLPGTHKTARFENVGIGQNMGAIFEVYPQWREIEPVCVPMKAGSCSFHNGLLAHGAGPNMTTGWRRAMTCGFMPDRSTFNGKQNILSREQMDRLNIGDLLDDDAQNPLIYSRTKQRTTV